MARIRQYGTINMIIGRLYDGVFDLARVVREGDIGLGTFHALNGEMIIVDGACHQALADGRVRMADADVRSPYVTVGGFDRPESFDLSGLDGDMRISLVARIILRHHGVLLFRNNCLGESPREVRWEMRVV